MYNIYNKMNKTIIKSNFEKVMIFNRAFDMVSRVPEKYNCYVNTTQKITNFNPINNFRKEFFNSSPNIIKLRLDLIKEEIEELHTAIIENDIIEHRDACADILYVVYGMADVFGIAIDDVFNNKFQSKIIKYYMDIDNNIDNIDNINNNDNKSINMFMNKYIDATNNHKLTIDNFNNVKTFTNEFLEYDISSKSREYLITIIYDNIKSKYLELELNCYKPFEDYIDIPLYSSSYILNENRADYIAHNLYELLVWTYIMTVVIGVDANADFSIVHDSNMSKLCDTEEDAIDTVNDYNTKYIAGTSPYDSPYYYYLDNLDKWIVKNLSSGKALKNIKYKKVCFI